MPTILRSNGFLFVIYPNDHEPPHVHVVRSGAEMMINLGIEGGEPVIRDVYRMRNREIAIAMTVVRANNDLFLKRWKELCP
jgi:Domain of unknown function (DUF4160)